MLVYRPTHQTVKMLGESLVTLRNERVPTHHALMNGGSTFNDLSLNHSGSEHKVECSLVLCRKSSDSFAVGPMNKLRTTARRAFSTVNLNPLADPQIVVLAAPRLLLAPLQHLACANIDSLPLVIKATTLVDMVKR